MTKEERKKMCSTILNSYNKGDKLDELDSAIMLHEFRNHIAWEEKKGPGVKYIYVGNGKYNGKCFYIKRTDDTSIDISYPKCISNPNKYSAIKQAGRNTITNLIYNFKADNVIFNETLCSVTGEVLTKENASIDHYDMTFDDMIMIWIEKKGVDVIFNDLDHSGLGVFFKSDTIKNDFLDFHNTNCKLRAVTMNANLTICKQ